MHARKPVQQTLPPSKGSEGLSRDLPDLHIVIVWLWQRRLVIFAGHDKGHRIPA